MAFHLSEILEKENFYTIREMSSSTAHMLCFFLSLQLDFKSFERMFYFEIYFLRDPYL